MIESDTIKLLRECDAGVKMGVSSLNDVLPFVRSKDLAKKLRECKEKHETLGEEIEKALERFRDEGKDPPTIAKVMSTMKTDMKLAVCESDQTVAELMTDGCNMGVKSLSRYLNQYEAADEDAKNIAKRLIRLESDLAEEIRLYL